MFPWAQHAQVSVSTVPSALGAGLLHAASLGASSFYPCSTPLQTSSVCHAKLQHSSKRGELSINFDKFLCPFVSNPWGFSMHSFPWTAEIPGAGKRVPAAGRTFPHFHMSQPEFQVNCAPLMLQMVSHKSGGIR